jgi:hypothetical protein
MITPSNIIFCSLGILAPHSSKEVVMADCPVEMGVSNPERYSVFKVRSAAASRWCAIRGISVVEDGRSFNLDVSERSGQVTVYGSRPFFLKSVIVFDLENLSGYQVSPEVTLHVELYPEALPRRRRRQVSRAREGARRECRLQVGLLLEDDRGLQRGRGR